MTCDDRGIVSANDTTLADPAEKVQTVATDREQQLTFTSDGLTLEGVLHLPASSPSPAVVVCQPHPLYGGDMQNGVVVAICRAVAARGIAALRFNFRGVGGSQGSFGDGVGERADAAAALATLKTLRDVLPNRIGIVGYSFGAAVALFAAGSTVRAVVAVSTPTIARDASEIDVRCPALFVVGGRDRSATVDSISRLGPSVGRHARLAEVSSADHFWTGAEAELAIIVSRFLTDVLMDATARD